MVEVTYGLQWKVEGDAEWQTFMFSSPHEADAWNFLETTEEEIGTEEYVFRVVKVMTQELRASERQDIAARRCATPGFVGQGGAMKVEEVGMGEDFDLDGQRYMAGHHRPARGTADDAVTGSGVQGYSLFWSNAVHCQRRDNLTGGFDGRVNRGYATIAAGTEVVPREPKGLLPIPARAKEGASA